MDSINISFVQKIQTTSNLLCVCMIFLFSLEYFFFHFSSLQSFEQSCIYVLCIKNKVYLKQF